MLGSERSELFARKVLFKSSVPRFNALRKMLYEPFAVDPASVFGELVSGPPLAADPDE